MSRPSLYSHPGQILAFLDSEAGAGEWTAGELGARLGLTVPQVISACSSLFRDGLVARVGSTQAPRFLVTPHYPVMPAPRNPRREPLVPCIGLRLC